MTDVPDNFAALMIADRKARGLSRGAYADLVGLTIAKITNLEKGREPRPEELEKLRHVVFTEGSAGAPGDNLEAAEARAGLIARYMATLERCAGPAPIGYNLTWGTPDTAPEHNWPLIEAWCDNVMAELDRREAGEPVEGVPEIAPDGPDLGVPVGGFLPPQGDEAALPGPEEPSDEELEEVALEEEALATVTEPTYEDANAALMAGFARGMADPEAHALIEQAAAAVATSRLLPGVIVAPEAAFPDDGVRRFSNGQLRTIKRCRREYWLTYYRKLGLERENMAGSAAALGTRVHRCLAVLYVPDGTPAGDPLEELQRSFEEDVLVVGDDPIKFKELKDDVDLAHAMLEGYLAWLAETGADEGLHVVAPETTLEVDPRFDEALGTPVRLIAKLDVRAIREVANVESRVFLDHKTTDQFSRITRMVQFDEQMLHYDLCEFLDYLAHGASGEEAEQLRTDGAIYNMLRKVKRTASAKPPFYERVEIRHNAETLRSYWLRVRGTIEEILTLERRLDAGEDHRLVAPPNPTHDCHWRCDFYSVCTLFDDGSRAEDMLQEYYVEIDPLRRYAREQEGTTS